jgi:hypothetical protein
LPEKLSAEAAWGTEAFEAPEPDAAESGDPVRCAAVCDGATADAGVAEFVGFEAAPDACGVAPVPEEPGALPRSVVSVWLMSMSCSRLFTLTSWLMYSLGSVFEVGSWFCISVTSRVRKSLAEMVAELSLVPLEPLVLLVPVVALAMGVAAFGVSACPAVCC